MLQMQTKRHFKRDCMAENVHMYQEEEAEENINMRQKAKPITPKAILKRPNLETIEEDQEEVDVNLRKGSNLYQYNVVDDFRWTPTNMFFEDLMEVGSYRESIQQYLAAVKRKKQRNVKAAQVEEKPVYRSYVKLGRNSIQASWDTKAQISVCTSDGKFWFLVKISLELETEALEHHWNTHWNNESPEHWNFDGSSEFYSKSIPVFQCNI